MANAMTHNEFNRLWNASISELERQDANTLRAVVRYANNSDLLSNRLSGKEIVFMTKDDCVKMIANEMQQPQPLPKGVIETLEEKYEKQKEEHNQLEEPVSSESAPEPESTEEPEQKESNSTEEQTEDIEDIIRKVAGEMIIENNQTLLPMIQDIIQSAIAESKTEEQKAPTSESEHYHPIYETLYQTVKNDIPAMLVGPAGSGKSYIAEQVARALSLDFEYTAVGLQTTKSDLLGYMDANGNYVETALYRMYKNGGVFLLDEMDAGNPNVFTCLNNLMANGHGAFPCGMVKRHSDFRVIAAANTYGHGADMQYVGRNQMDAATKNRFATITMDYDKKLENKITDNRDWTKHVQALRKAAYELKEEIVISPRASIYGAKLLQSGLDQQAVEDMTIWQGISDDIKQRILNKVMGKTLY